LSIEGRLVAGFELAPLNLELMAEVEREAALESLAAFYDAISRPFQLLSVPAQRDPEEHLAAIEDRVEGKRNLRAFAAYGALYREIAAAPRRPLRRTYLLLDAASEPELRRVLTSLARVAEERGVLARGGGAAPAPPARRSVQAGRGRIYLVDTVLLVDAAEAPTLSERIESLRLEGR